MHHHYQERQQKGDHCWGMWRQCSVLRSSIFNQESSVTPLLTQLHIPPLGGKNNRCLKYSAKKNIGPAQCQAGDPVSLCPEESQLVKMKLGLRVVSDKRP